MKPKEAYGIWMNPKEPLETLKVASRRVNVPNQYSYT